MSHPHPTPAHGIALDVAQAYADGAAEERRAILSYLRRTAIMTRVGAIYGDAWADEIEHKERHYPAPAADEGER